MLSQTSEDKQLINVTAARPKANGPFRSNLEAQPELKKKQEELHLQWPQIKETQHVVDRTLGLYQPVPCPPSGLLPQFRIPGIKSFPPKTFTPPIRSLPPYRSAGNSMKTHLSCWNHQPPQPLIKFQMRRLPSVLTGLKPLQPDLLTPLPYPIRPWKLSITSSRRSSFSYALLLPRTLSRMTLLRWPPTASQLNCTGVSTHVPRRRCDCHWTVHTLAYASEAYCTGVSRSIPASTG